MFGGLRTNVAIFGARSSRAGRLIVFGYSFISTVCCSTTVLISLWYQRSLSSGLRVLSYAAVLLLGPIHSFYYRRPGIYTASHSGGDHQYQPELADRDWFTDRRCNVRIDSVQMGTPNPNSVGCCVQRRTFQVLFKLRQACICLLRLPSMDLKDPTAHSLRFHFHSVVRCSRTLPRGEVGQKTQSISKTEDESQASQPRSQIGPNFA